MTIVKHIIQKVLFTNYVKQELGLDMVTEFRFHPKRRWKFDYAIPNYKIAIEVEGGIWKYGRHNRASGFLLDIEKYNEASVAGWILIRTTPENLCTAQTLSYISKAIDTRKFTI